jgi:endonuclease YncB( thermonuclease family)
MRLFKLALPTALAGVAMLLPAAPASARKAQCIGGFKGSKCLVWNGRVKAVDDGDTLTVRVAGQGVQKVRLNGINAMELWNYKPNHRRGYCHALEARSRLDRLVKGSHRRVRLYAQHKNSRSIGEGRSRFRRTIAVKSGGRWIDAGSVLIREGHGLFLPNGDEWAWNGPYTKAVQLAQRRGKNLWNDRACGVGPFQSSRIHMKVKWDAQNNDAKNINGEWVRLTNLGDKRISLRGWWMRDSYLRGKLHGAKKGRGFTFPGSAAIAPNGTLTIYAGKGKNSATKLHWGLGDAPFENATNDKKRVGDGAYLFDPQGDIRAFMQYPCRIGNCRDTLTDKVDVRATFRGTEYVTVKNKTDEVLDLTEYEIESVPWFFEFARGTQLQPHQSIILYIGRGSKRGKNTITKNWGFNVGLLGDRKDAVTLRNPFGAPVVCDSWGGVKCPSV